MVGSIFLRHVSATSGYVSRALLAFFPVPAYVGDIACHVSLVWQLLLLLTTHDGGSARQIMSGLVSWLRLTKLGASLCAWYITWAVLRCTTKIPASTRCCRRRCSGRRMPPRLVRARTTMRAPFKPGTRMPRGSLSKRAADETLAWCSSRRWQPCHARGCGL